MIAVAPDNGLNGDPGLSGKSLNHAATQKFVQKVVVLILPYVTQIMIANA